MKNINEVIKELEESRVQTETGTGYWVGYRDNDDLKADALHYLKEYHDIKATMDWHEEMELIRNGIVNPPLTWDELRKMEGKPVWIDSVPLVRRWVIIKKFHPIGGNKNLFDMEVEDGAHFLRKNMRRDDPAWWLAYRKERE